MHFVQTPKCGKISSKTSQPDFVVKNPSFLRNPLSVKTQILVMAKSMKPHNSASAPAAKKRVSANKNNAKMLKMKAKSKISKKSANALQATKIMKIAKATKYSKAMPAAKAINMRATKATRAARAKKVGKKSAPAGVLTRSMKRKINTKTSMMHMSTSKKKLR